MEDETLRIVVLIENSVEKSCRVGVQLLEHLRNQDFLDVLAYFRLHKEIVREEFVVLGGNHYCVDSYRFSSLPIIFNCKL